MEISKRIIEDAKKEVKKIIENSEKEASVIKEQAENKKKEIVVQSLEEAKRELSLIRMGFQSEARIHAMKMIQQEKENVLNHTFELALKKLENLPSSEYSKFIKNALDKIKSLDGEITIYTDNPELVKKLLRFKAKVVKGEKGISATNGQLTLIATVGDLLDFVKEKHRGEISRLLFA